VCEAVSSRIGGKRTEVQLLRACVLRGALRFFLAYIMFNNKKAHNLLLL
jgi:hypothetical protein